MRSRMNEGLTIEETTQRFSYRLLEAYNEKECHLEFQFLCLHCHGISINPLFCELCKYSYCEKCIESIPDSKVSCLCKKSCKANFSKDFNHELYNSYYFIKDFSAPSKTIQITYTLALYYENNSACIFIPSENVKDKLFIVKKTKKKKKQKKKKGKGIDEKGNKSEAGSKKSLKNHQDRIAHRFLKKSARIINFHNIKGFKLNLQKKKLCEKHSYFMRMVHLKTITFGKCLWETEFALHFYQAMIFNRKRLSAFTIGEVNKNDKSLNLLMILNAISVCSNLRQISLWIKFNDFNDFILPKSFYNFLSKCFLLKRIDFEKMLFYNCMNFSPFQSLQSLENISFHKCRFDINCFEELYINNFPNLKSLELDENDIRLNFNDHCKSKSYSILKSIMIFPSILIIKLRNFFSRLEKLIFDKLILSQKISIKYLDLEFSFVENSETILCFFKFLKSSKIQFLSLTWLSNAIGFDSPEFLDFLGNSDSLLALDLECSGDFKFDLILRELSKNKTIQILALSWINLSDFSSSLVNLINNNNTISTFILKENKWKIDATFIDAILKSKTLLYLILHSFIKIEDDLALKLSESNLKGINVNCAEIKQSTKDLIYKKIPQIDYYSEYPENLLYNQKFLRTIN